MLVNYAFFRVASFDRIRTTLDSDGYSAPDKPPSLCPSRIKTVAERVTASGIVGSVESHSLNARRRRSKRKKRLWSRDNMGGEREGISVCVCERESVHWDTSYLSRQPTPPLVRSRSVARPLLRL